MERVFELSKIYSVRLYISRIDKGEDGIFSAQCIIQWPGNDDKSIVGLGIDEIDALFNSIRVAEAFLTNHRSFKCGELTWLGKSDLCLISSYAQNE